MKSHGSKAPARISWIYGISMVSRPPETGILSGKHRKGYGKTPVFMGKSTIHAHFVCLPEGKSHEITIFPWMFQEISSPPILFRAFSVSSAFRRSSECSGASSPLPQKHGRRFVARPRKMLSFAVKFGVSPCFQWNLGFNK